MPTLMYRRDERCAFGRGEQRRFEAAFLGIGFTFVGTGVETTHRREGRLLPGESDEGVVLAGDMDDGQRFEVACFDRQRPSDRADGGQDVRPSLPKDITERGAVRMTHRINTPVVDRTLLLQIRQNRIKELDVPVATVADRRLPAGMTAFLVDEWADGRQALRVNQNRSGIGLVEGPTTHGLRRITAMPVPAEDHGQRRLRIGGNADERGALGAIDRPGALGEAIGRATG